MKSSQEREEALIRAAFELPPGVARRAFLDQACADDPALRQRLETLLAGRERPDGLRGLEDGVALRRDKVREAASKGPGVAEASPPDAALRATIKLELPSEPADEAVGQTLGRYKLLEKVGEGGCGVVYVAEQTVPVRRRVALKVIKLGMDTKQVVARFEAERQALAMMDHPNIAKVLDAGTTEQGRPFFVMELVRGIRITNYCDQNNLTTKERLDLFVKVCQAIQHAHQKGIIHRDIKPSNILVTLHDGVPEPKVIDFGIAKATAGRLTDQTLFTRFEQFIGTPAYMSPEQAEVGGLDIDTRSDIYSLGVVLYELLTGRTPFDSEALLRRGIEELILTLREVEPPRPSTRLATVGADQLTTTAKRRSADTSELLHQIKGDLDWIVMKSLEKDRMRRYETANGLAADLKRHLNNEPVVARPPSAAYRLQKAWRRNQVAFTAGALVAAALVVGIAVSSWQAVEASRARNAEKEQRLAAQTERDKAQAAERTEMQARLRADHLLYVANMNLAQQAWEQNNVGRVRQLIEDTATWPGRGFEWFYWQRQTHLELKTLRGHSSDIWSVAYSPDGQWIVSGGDDGSAKVWEAASGRELLTLKGPRAAIYSVACSLDNRRIVTGSGDQTAKVWEAASGRELLSLKGHNSGINAVAFSLDGQRIISGSADYTAKVWEAASGRELLTLKGHRAQLWSVVYSPDGQRIVTGSADRTTKVWEAASGQELFTLTGHGDRIRSVAYSPDGQRIATGSADETAKIWEAVSGREMFTLKGQRAQIYSVAFSPDSQRVVTGSDDQTAKVWETATGRELLTLKGHGAGITSVALSPDGQRIVTGSFDQTAKVWEATSSRELLTLNGHSAGINAVACSPEGQRIITGSRDQMAKVWETASGRELVTLKGHGAAINSVGLSPDGQRIITGSSDQTARVWEAGSGRELFTLQGRGGAINSAVFSPDGQRIVIGSFDPTAKVLDAASGLELFALQRHGGAILAVAFSPDGQRILTGSFDQTAKVWEATSGRELLTLKGHSAEISSVALSPDGQRIVTGSFDQTAKVWEAASGRELLTLKGHGAGINAVAYSPDGQRIVTGSFDRTVKVWETASGKELLTLKGHGDAISSVAFSADGQRIVTGSRDQTAKVWDAATAQQVAAWQAEERAAAQYLIALEHKRTGEQEHQRIARARNSIKQWLILAPIALATGQSGEEGLDAEQIEGEGQLRPKPGETRSIGGGELKWREVALEDYVIDFNAILGQVKSHCVAYAVCHIRSESEHRGLQMLVGSDDEAKLYLNGQQVHKAPFPRQFVAEQDEVPDIVLNAGLNVLVFKVVNEGGDWKGSIRFADAQGNPVKGIKVTLEPEAKD